MDTLIVETNARLFFTNAARVVRSGEEVSDDLAAQSNFSVERSNPFVKWIVGDFVEADNPNSNTQFWTKGDLALSEYSIRYSPLNMLHKQRVPIGFFSSTRTLDLTGSNASLDQAQGTAKIEALAGMWSHVFPFESALIDQADEAGALFYSMECRGTHLHCAGPNGCDSTFDYFKPEDHCVHLKERSSIRHIVNPIFRGGAVIIPPTQPGWKNASATVMQQAVRDEAARYAEQTEAAYDQLVREGAPLSASAWEHLMGTIVTLGRH